MALDFCVGDCGSDFWPALQAIATLLLVAGAGFTAWQVWRQIRQDKEQHADLVDQAADHNDQQIRALLRPVVVVRSGTIDLDADTGSVFPPVVNVGVGPALAIDIRAWIRFIEPGSMPNATPDEVSQALDEEMDEVMKGPHHLQLMISALGIGDTSQEWLRLRAIPDLAQHRGGAYTLGYKVTYEDAMGTHYDPYLRTGGGIR